MQQPEGTFTRRKASSMKRVPILCNVYLCVVSTPRGLVHVKQVKKFVYHCMLIGKHIFVSDERLVISLHQMHFKCQ